MKKRQLRRKEKVYREKVPKQKKIHSKKAVKWIWCLVLFLCFSGGLAFFQSMKTKVQVSFSERCNPNNYKRKKYKVGQN